MYNDHIRINTDKEVKQAMQEQTLKDFEKNIDKYRINILEELPLPEIAYSLANTKKDGFEILGTLGNFSVVIGKAKAKKSFFINIVLASVVSNELIVERIKGHLPTNKRKVIYIDTEQGKYHVQKATRRICTQIEIDNPDNLEVYYFRSLTPAERLAYIEKLIYSAENLGFLVIDGIKDLVTSINDEEQATNVVSKLLKWSEERNIHIVTVLHQNKGDNNARGHIGTELINKAETVLEVAKNESDSNISIVTPLQCRGIEPEVFAFEIDENGIPILAENFELRTETKQKKFDVLEIDDRTKFEILETVYKNATQFSFKELETQIKIASKVFGKEFGNNAIGKLIEYCKNQKWLLQTARLKPYTLGTFQEIKIEPKPEPENGIEF